MHLLVLVHKFKEPYTNIYMVFSETMGKRMLLNWWVDLNCIHGVFIFLLTHTHCIVHLFWVGWQGLDLHQGQIFVFLLSYVGWFWAPSTCLHLVILSLRMLEFLPPLICVVVVWCLDSFTFYDSVVNRLFCMMFSIWCVKLQSLRESGTYPVQDPLLKITSSTLNTHCEHLFWWFSMLLLLLNTAICHSIDTVCCSH